MNSEPLHQEDPPQTRTRRPSLCGQCDGLSPWCGQCYEVKKGRVQKGKHSTRPMVVEADPDRPVPPRTPEQVAAQPPPPKYQQPSHSWHDLYPHLYAHLTQGRHEDRSVRVTSTLLVFLEDGRLKLCLHDRDQGLVTFLTVSSMPEGLAELEAGLAARTLEWRRKREPKRK